MSPRIAIVVLVLLSPVFAGRLEAGESAPGFDLGDGQGAKAAFDPGSCKSGEATLIVFLDPEQEASRDVAKEVARLLAGDEALGKAVRGIVIATSLPEGDKGEAVRQRLVAGGKLALGIDGEGAVRRSYGVIVMPTTFVVGKGGAIAAVLPGRSATYRSRLGDALRKVLGLDAAPERPAPEAAQSSRRLKLAQALIARGRWAQAAEQLEKAREQGPADEALLVLLGEVRLELGEGSAAEECFSKALEVAPKSKPARVGLAIAKALGPDKEEAEKLLRAEVRRPHADPGLWYGLGRLLEERGEFKEAAACYRKAYERLKRLKDVRHDK